MRTQRIADGPDEEGCGMTNLNKDVHGLARAIQMYFESLVP